MNLRAGEQASKRRLRRISDARNDSSSPTSCIFNSYGKAVIAGPCMYVYFLKPLPEDLKCQRQSRLFRTSGRDPRALANQPTFAQPINSRAPDCHH